MECSTYFRRIAGPIVIAASSSIVQAYQRQTQSAGHASGFGRAGCQLPLLLLRRPAASTRPRSRRRVASYSRLTPPAAPGAGSREKPGSSRRDGRRSRWEPGANAAGRHRGRRHLETSTVQPPCTFCSCSCGQTSGLHGTGRTETVPAGARGSTRSRASLVMMSPLPGARSLARTGRARCASAARDQPRTVSFATR